MKALVWTGVAVMAVVLVAVAPIVAALGLALAVIFLGVKYARGKPGPQEHETQQAAAYEDE